MSEVMRVPEWTPLVPEMPHRFRDCTRVLIACRMRGAASLVPAPLEPIGDLVVVSWLQGGDVNGYPMRNVAVNVPTRFESETGKACIIEYIDLDMGLVAGREGWAWPKKGAELTWQLTETGLLLECRRHGHLLFRSTVAVPEPPAPVDGWPPDIRFPEIGPSGLQARYFAPTPFARPNRAEVALIDTPNHVVHSRLTAQATLEIFSSPKDPLERLGSVTVLAAQICREEFELGEGVIIGGRPL